MDLGRLVWLLSKRQLWLTRADLLDDSHEATTPPGTLSEIQRLIADGVLPPDFATTFREQRRELRRLLFVNCWHINEHEAENMWHRYCGPVHGVAVKTSYRRLAESIGNNQHGALQIGRVNYIDYAHEKIPVNSSILAPAMHKRIQYSSENEIRIVLLDQWRSEHGKKTLGHGIEWNPETHLSAIVVHPKADFWFIESVDEVIAKFAPSLRGAQWSTLKASPPD
jgi:hypothetical protein